MLNCTYIEKFSDKNVSKKLNDNKQKLEANSGKADDCFQPLEENEQHVP